MSDPRDFSYDAVIPSAMLFDKTIEPAAMKLYAVIRSLSHAYGYCFASNGYLAKMLDSGESTVRTWLRSLKKGGYIEIKNSTTTNRHIIISDKFKRFLRVLENEHPPRSNSSTPLLENEHHIKEEINKEKKMGGSAGARSISPDLFQDGKVRMTHEKAAKLMETYGTRRVREYVDKLNDYADARPDQFNKYRCHAAVIRMWIKRDGITPIEKDDARNGPQNASIVKTERHPDAVWLDSRPEVSKLQIQGKLVVSEKFVNFPHLPEATVWYGVKGFRDMVDSFIRKSLPVPKI